MYLLCDEQSGTVQVHQACLFVGARFEVWVRVCYPRKLIDSVNSCLDGVTST